MIDFFHQQYFDNGHFDWFRTNIIIHNIIHYENIKVKYFIKELKNSEQMLAYCLKIGKVIFIEFIQC